MDIRFLGTEDWPQIKALYNNHFSEMDFPDFYNTFLCSYVVHEGNKIIAAGGLKPLVEAVIISDKSLPVRVRREALLKMKEALVYSTQKIRHKQLYAFTYDDEYAKHLTERMGFKQIKESKLLVLEL